jgi:hypothetical protein
MPVSVEKDESASDPSGIRTRVPPTPNPASLLGIFPNLNIPTVSPTNPPPTPAPQPTSDEGEVLSASGAAPAAGAAPGGYERPSLRRLAPHEMPTSALMLCAAFIVECCIAADGPEYLLVAGELRARAGLLALAARREQRSCGVVHTEPCELLAEIGEVHS